MPRYLEIARQALRRADHANLSSTYSALVSRAIQRIDSVCQPGALQWARQTCPALTDTIDVDLFKRLNDLWNNDAPVADFEAALQELVTAHAEVGRLYREHRGISHTLHSSEP